MTRLGEAGELLSLGELAFSKGDYDSALTYAGQSQERLSGFVDEAEDLEELAFNEQYMSFTTDVLIFVVGTSVIVVGSIIVWLLLKKRTLGLVSK